MTDQSLVLLDVLLDLTYSKDASKEQLAAYNAFKAHIEELERKAQAWDSMLASPGNAHPLSTDHMLD